MALYRLTRSVFVQDESKAPGGIELESWPKFFHQPGGNVAHVSHVVNLFKGDPAAASIQEATVRSLRVAARFSEAEPIRHIHCISEGDTITTPEGFVASRPLTRNVLDCETFSLPRRLPLLFDILESGSEQAYSDGFLVFSNADICLQPHFYRAISALLSQGFDSLIINRRTVSSMSWYAGFEEFGLMESGARHQGLDCFVFPVAWVRDFARSYACVGAGWVMRSLLYNLVARTQAMLIMRDVHLTYHFGDDRTWAHGSLSDYDAFNLRQAQAVLVALSNNPGYRDSLADFCRANNEPLQLVSKG